MVPKQGSRVNNRAVRCSVVRFPIIMFDKILEIDIMQIACLYDPLLTGIPEKATLRLLLVNGGLLANVIFVGVSIGTIACHPLA